jgi:hypothetical protein
MKVWKICLTIVGLGLLFMLASCSKEVSKDATEGFLASLTTMFAEAMSNESNQVLGDFISNSPPGPNLGSYASVLGMTELDEGKLRDLRAPYGIDTLYGTWRYNAGTDEWYLYNPDNPENAILFEWAYLDTASVAHAAEILVDSLEFYQDSLPENLWVGIKIDDEPTWLAWIKLEATYVSLEQVSDVSLIYEIVGYYQVGIEISSPTAIDSNFVGSVHLWVIDLTNDYQVDLTITRNNNDSGVLVLEDSDGWRMSLNVSEDVSSELDYERRNISGEITRDGNHAADISGYIWDPEDGTHDSQITIVFSDGEEGDFEDYLAVGLLTVGN